MLPVVFLLLCLSPAALAANILAVFPVVSFSHQIVYRRLMVELNRRGHNVTIITPNPLRDPSLKNYREVDTSKVYKTWDEKMIADPKDLRFTQTFPELFYIFFSKTGVDFCHLYLSDPGVQALIKENQTFDLLISEFGAYPCMYGFVKFSEFKHMGIFSLQAGTIVQSNFGNPATASYIPDFMLPYTDRMSFLQRLRLFVFQTFVWGVYRWTMETHDVVAKTYFGDDLPNLVELERNLSALLVNSHFAMSFPRPYLPNLVEIGAPAFHIIGRKPKPLPKELKAFMDGATHGVVYFSLGTNVKTGNLSEKILIETFKKIPQRVVWKWANDDLVVGLNNVFKSKWLPQVDILAHPKTKAFVTQGGLQSIGEALEYNIPMIVMPFFADQGHNAKKLEISGVGITLDYDTLTVDTFTAALKEIVNNRTYKENAKKLSELVKDQPIPPLEKAVWWTEYVIRHDGAPHLRSAAATMPWYQYFLLDVLAFIFISLSLLFYVIYLLGRTLLRCVFPKRKKPKKD